MDSKLRRDRRIRSNPALVRGNPAITAVGSTRRRSVSDAPRLPPMCAPAGCGDGHVEVSKALVGDPARLDRDNIRPNRSDGEGGSQPTDDVDRGERCYETCSRRRVPGRLPSSGVHSRRVLQTVSADPGASVGPCSRAPKGQLSCGSSAPSTTQHHRNRIAVARLP